MRRSEGNSIGMLLAAAFLLCSGLHGILFPSSANAMELGGQLTLRGALEDYASGFIFPELAGDALFSQSGDLRITGNGSLDASQEFEVHYEAVYSRTERNTLSLQGGLPFQASAVVEDTRRALDLTSVFLERGKTIAYHRLDRLAYHYRGDWGTLTIGREAITWGNGLVFNPMDLFNPFSPTDVERDYKVGDDLVLVNLYGADWNAQTDWQILLVPRRSPVTGDLESESSSLALKAHLYAGSVEWDLLGALHYDEPVVGMGRTGYLGNAVWRMDATATFAGSDDVYFSAIANIDYSWVLGGMNAYGSLELHYNNIGVRDYADLPGETALLERLERGEVHVVGRSYVAPSLQLELHPLVNLYTTAIVNLDDPSGVLLPRLVWSLRQDLEITAGASLPLGPAGSEFGGLPVPGSQGQLSSPERFYVWLKAWF